MSKRYAEGGFVPEWAIPKNQIIASFMRLRFLIKLGNGEIIEEYRLLYPN